MSEKTAVQCDHCKKTEPTESFRLPHGWFKVTIKTWGYSYGSNTEAELDACCAVCLAALVRGIADKHHPRDVPNPTNTRGPYR